MHQGARSVAKKKTRPMGRVLLLRSVKLQLG